MMDFPFQLLTEEAFLDQFKKVLNSVRNKISAQALRPGHIITFQYSAKGFQNDTLNFYDQFPIVVVTSVEPNHFTGFNVHYIPRRIKLNLLRYLMDKYKNIWFPPKKKEPVKPEVKKSSATTTTEPAATPTPYTFAVLKKKFPQKSDADINKIIRDQQLKFKQQQERIKKEKEQSKKKDERGYITPDEFMAKTDTTRAQLPNFNFNLLVKAGGDFNFIAKSCVHKYIKNLAMKITLIDVEAFGSLCSIETSRWQFKNDSIIKTPADVWNNWKRIKSFQQRNAYSTTRPGA